MMKKKGWIKIAEAFIAIVIIATVVVSVYSWQNSKKSHELILNIGDVILDEIVRNDNFRQDVLNDDLSEISVFADSKVPSGLNFSLKICGAEDICNLDEYRAEVYSRERIISSTLEDYNPKKLKIFLWKE